MFWADAATIALVWSVTPSAPRIWQVSDRHQQRNSALWATSASRTARMVTSTGAGWGRNDGTTICLHVLGRGL